MIVKAHMYAFDNGKVRDILVPDEAVEGKTTEAVLEEVFYYGQNDFAVGPEKNTTCSLSVGDQVELHGKLWRCETFGWGVVKA